MSERKAVIKNADMSEEMQQDAVDCATQALEKYNIEKVSQRVAYHLEIFSWFIDSIYVARAPTHENVCIWTDLAHFELP